VSLNRRPPPARAVALLVLALAPLAAAGSCPLEGKPVPSVLVFSKTAGFRHESIAAGKAAIVELGEQWSSWKTDTTEDAGRFTDESLKRYDAVVFLNTTGDVLNEAQQAAFERYIRGGGGFAGIHSAADTEYDWPFYGRLVGAYFANHPAIQPATFSVRETWHPSTHPLPARFELRDEIYNFRPFAPGLQLQELLAVDESTYDGGTHGEHHLVAWYQLIDGGRAFYTALGHTPEIYSDSLFRTHLRGGIRSAALGVYRP
jgi:type 1 glutamine amidotransferase